MNTVAFPSVPNNVTFSKTFTYQASAGPSIDLTGSTFAMQVRRSAGEIELIAVPVVTVINAIQGRFTVGLTRAQMARIAPGAYVHDLVRTRPDGTSEQVWTGTMMVVQGVTR